MIGPQSLFFDTFGYIKINSNKDKNKVLTSFENEITSALNYSKLSNINHCTVQNSNRPNNLRYHNFTDDNILDIFYNDYVLDKIYELTADFIVLSPIESFHLLNSKIHKDNATEIKRIKLLYYLDVLDTNDKGPLWVIPGTHHIYDRYNSLVGKNINWPPKNGVGGSGFVDNNEYFENNIPKTYLYTNNEIILFNPNLCHGSNGNINNNILRRCIGMTIMCVDRTNEILMKKINNFLTLFNINNTESNPYNYVIKHNLTRWKKHFIIPNGINSDFNSNEDGSDTNHLDYYNKKDLFRNYNNSLKEVDVGIYNCNVDKLKEANKISYDGDCFGVAV
jgi:hypothetical protein